MAFFFYIGKRLHTFCTPFAHLPESGAFLRKVCTACFPLHKKSLVGARPLHLAGARPFCRLKAPLGLSLLRYASQTRTCRGKAPPSCWRKTVLSLKSPTGAFIAALRFANANLSGQGPSILLAQDRSVTQKPHWGFCCFANVNLLCKQNSRQFSAFVCVHQPDGFKDLLTGDFCCHRLFILPGLGCCRGQVLGVEVCKKKHKALYYDKAIRTG